jgi:glycosyltransferase involved in cell wall biosynthesis
VGEYLSAGLPFVTNAGIGDLDSVIRQDRVGVVVEQPDSTSLVAAAHQTLQLLREPGLAERCLSCARRRYDLDTIALPRYRAVYQRFLGAACEPWP